MRRAILGSVELVVSSESNFWVVQRPVVEMCPTEILSFARVAGMRIEGDPFHGAINTGRIDAGKQMMFSNRCAVVGSQGAAFAGDEISLKKSGLRHPSLAEILWFYVSYAKAYGGSAPFFGKYIISSSLYPERDFFVAVAYSYTQAISFVEFNRGGASEEFAFLAIRNC